MATKKAKSKAGRKPWVPNAKDCEMAEVLARKGFMDFELAEAFGIDPASLRSRKKKKDDEHQRFFAAIKNGRRELTRENLDGLIAATQDRTVTENGNEKVIAGSVVASIFLVKREDERPQQELRGELGAVALKRAKLELEKLAAEVKILRKQLAEQTKSDEAKTVVCYRPVRESDVAARNPAA